ncbi:hypothetical protein ES703_40438 [subsurface metagenome]
MALKYFNQRQLGILGEALDIAEDMTSNYFKLSLSQWKRHPFDVKTLSNLFGEDIKDNTFALLKKYMEAGNGKREPLYKRRESYLICMQDHHILKALRRDSDLELLPLLAYILTHELVHIVRFCNFQMRFDTQEEHSRVKEERIVHQTTYKILKELSLPSLSYILGSYNPNRMNVDICMV